MPLHSAKQITGSSRSALSIATLGSGSSRELRKKRVGLPVGGLKVGDLIENGDRSGNAGPSEVSPEFARIALVDLFRQMIGRSRQNETGARTCAVSRQQRAGQKQIDSLARRDRAAAKDHEIVFMARPAARRIGRLFG